MSSSKIWMELSSARLKLVIDRPCRYMMICRLWTSFEPCPSSTIFCIHNAAIIHNNIRIWILHKYIQHIVIMSVSTIGLLASSWAPVQFFLQSFGVTWNIWITRNPVKQVDATHFSLVALCTCLSAIGSRSAMGCMKLFGLT